MLRLDQSLPDRADILRRTDVPDDQDDGGLYDEPGASTSDPHDSADSYEPVDEGVPCQFADESSEYVRGDSGEVVKNPATVVFDPTVDLREDDRIRIHDVDDVFEIAGISTTTDHFRGIETSLEATLRRES